MAGLTQSLTFAINAKTQSAVSGLKAVERELDLLERDAKKAGVAFDRVGERNAKLTPLQGTISGISAKTGIAEQTISRFGATAALAGGAFATAFAVKSVQAASNLNETLSKTKVVFGDASDAVIAFARDADKIGLSDRAALDAASSFGALFLGIGKTKDESAELGINLTKLAADMASFSNTSLETAITAIGSGLRGENEPLRQFNVLLDDATLKTEALKLGLISSTTAALTPAVKAQAAYSAILGQTSLQQGDYARTSEGLANTTRTFTANVEDLEAALGQGLIPAATSAVGVLNDLVTVIGPLIHGLGEAKGAVDHAASALPGLAGGLADVFKNRVFHLIDPTGITKVTDAIHEVTALKDALTGAKKTADLDFVAFNRVARSIEAADNAMAAGTSTFQQATGQAYATAAAQNTLNNSLRSTVTLYDAISNAYQHMDTSITSNDPFANFVPTAETQLTSFGDAFAFTIGNAASSGVGAGLDDAKEDVDELGDYLRAVAEERLSSLDNVFAGLSSKLSFDDATSSLQEVVDKLAALKAESANLKGDIAGQQSLVGSLLAQSLTITPTEQVAIEQAEKALADTLARFQGTITQATAPSSSFLGPTTTDVFNAPTASLAELQVAEERLAEAKATAVGPTRELEAAEKALVDMRERQRDLPKLIADANRDLTKAQLALVDAQRQLNDAGQALIDQGPEFTTWFQTIATQAGLTGAALAGFTANLTAAMRAGGGAKGLVDVFGNGTRFASPSDANDILSYISGQFGGPRINKFAGGGLVPGYPGQPQMILAHGGERVSQAGAGGGGGSINVTVNAGMGADGQAIARYVHQELLALQRRSGRLGLN